MSLSGRSLVTGGAGFIGSHIIDTLLRRKANVIVLDDFSGGKKENLKQHHRNPNFKLVQGNLLIKKDVSKALKDCTVIFHLAANPEVQSDRKSVV